MLQMIGCALLAAVNLLQNPSFEDWPDGEPLPRHWQSYNEKAASSRISRLEAVGTDGEYALRYTNAGLDHSVYQDVPVRRPSARRPVSRCSGSSAMRAATGESSSNTRRAVSARRSSRGSSASSRRI